MICGKPEFYIHSSGVYIRCEGASVGRLDIESRPNGWTPHYTIYTDRFKRLGFMSQALDLWRQSHPDPRLIWSYTIPYVGNGICTHVGRAFARNYAWTRGLPKPYWRDEL